MNDPGARTLITAPTVEPFTLAEAKLQLRVTTTTDDSRITFFIKAARVAMERHLRRALINQTWEVAFDRFPCQYEREIELPLPKLQSVTYFKYIDSDGQLVTLVEDTDYEVLTNTDPGKVVLLPDVLWPITQYGRYQTVKIKYVAGYGASAASIPEPIMEAMMLHIGDMYENRENTIVGTISTSIPQNSADLVHDYRCVRFFG